MVCSLTVRKTAIFFLNKNILGQNCREDSFDPNAHFRRKQAANVTPEVQAGRQDQVF